MAAYIAIILSSISIILLIVVLIRFKKLFSTDSIIEKTKAKMNQVISDINQNANMDIDLINDATKRIRVLMKEADSKMEEFKEAAKILRDMIATVETESRNKVDQSHIYMKNSLIDEIKPVGNVNNYSGRVSSLKIRAYQEADSSISDKEDFSSDKTEQDNNFLPEKRIPKIVTNIIPNNNVQKKSLNDRVERLFRTGMNVEDIAMELSCSSSEVQFIIDMLSERG